MRLRHAVVCLGQLLQNSSIDLLADSLKSRLSLSLKLFDTTPLPKVLVLTGGDVAKIGVSEAQAMRLFLHQQRSLLDDDKLLLEELACNTAENALNCKRLLSAGWSGVTLNVTVVTNEFHAPRARLIFKSVFNESIVQCSIASSRQNCPQSNALLKRRINQEIMYLPKLPAYLSEKYGLSECCLPTCAQVDEALEELRVLADSIPPF